jgi:hypothetical protein
MSYAKPIWNDVTSCRYNSNKSWGGHNDVSTTTYTGSSPSNSEKLAVVDVSRKFYNDFVVFNFYVDKKLIKQNINRRNKDKAGEFLEQRKSNFLNYSNQDTHPVNKKLKK